MLSSKERKSYGLKRSCDVPVPIKRQERVSTSSGKDARLDLRQTSADISPDISLEYEVQKPPTLTADARERDPSDSCKARENAK